MRVLLQLLVNGCKVRQRVFALRRLGLPLTGQHFRQPLVVPIAWQRPADAGSFGGFQVLMNRALGDRAATGDLLLLQP